MKIEWVLENSEFCNGCPCLSSRGGLYYQNSCGLGWPVPDSRRFEGMKVDMVERPEVCKRRNGP